MPKHAPVAVSQNGAADERAAHSAFELQLKATALVVTGWQVPLVQLKPVEQRFPAQQAWPWPPHAAPAVQVPPWQIKGETQALFGGQHGSPAGRTGS